MLLNLCIYNKLNNKIFTNIISSLFLSIFLYKGLMIYDFDGLQNKQHIACKYVYFITILNMNKIFLI